MFNTVHNHKDVNLRDNLRFRKVEYVLDDKIVATESKLQYKDPSYDWWNNIDVTNETIHVKDEKELWENHNLKVKQ